jgi:hypothetical protein
MYKNENTAEIKGDPKIFDARMSMRRDGSLGKR